MGQGLGGFLPLALLVALSSLSGTWGAIFGWTGKAGKGQWQTNGNWNISGFPTSIDDVYISGPSVPCTCNTVPCEFRSLVVKDGSFTLYSQPLTGVSLTVARGGHFILEQNCKADIQHLVVDLGGTMKMAESTMNSKGDPSTLTSWTVQKGGDLHIQSASILIYGNFTLDVDSGANIVTQSPIKMTLYKAGPIADIWSPGPLLNFDAPMEMGRSSSILPGGTADCIYKPDAPYSTWANVAFKNLTISGTVTVGERVVFKVPTYIDKLHVGSKSTVQFADCTYISNARLETGSLMDTSAIAGAATIIEQLFGPGHLKVTKSTVQIMTLAIVGGITQAGGNFINKGQVRADMFTLVDGGVTVDKSHGAVFNITHFDIKGQTVHFKGGKFHMVHLVTRAVNTYMDHTVFEIAKTMEIPYNQSKGFHLCKSRIWLRKGGVAELEAPVMFGAQNAKCNSTIRMDGFVNVSTSLELLSNGWLDVYGVGHFAVMPAASLLANLVGFAVGGVVIHAKSSFRCLTCVPKMAQVLAYRADQDYPTWPGRSTSSWATSIEPWRPGVGLDPSNATLAVLFVMEGVSFHCGAVCDKLDFDDVGPNGKARTTTFNMSVVDVSGTIAPLPYPPSAFDPQPVPPPTTIPIPTPPVFSPKNSCPPHTPPDAHSAFPLALILVGAGGLLVGLIIGAIIMKRISAPKVNVSSPRRRQAGSRGRGNNEQEAMLN